jgi:AbrB family looped-hinge helix DNA binding protein
MEKNMSEISVRIQEKGQVTIPQKIRVKLNLKKGDMVVFEETENGVMVKPVTMISKDDQQEELKAIVHSIRERFKDYSVDEIESLVNEAIKETREKRI